MLPLYFLVYISFLVLDLIFPGTLIVTALKYLGIILCLAHVIRRAPADYFLQLALGFTLLADTILILDHTSTIGVFVFCLAQFFHIARLSRVSFSSRAFFIYILVVVLVFFFGVSQHFPPLYPLAGVYLSALIFNLIRSGAWYFSEKSRPAAAAFFGFILFSACDTCVGVSYFSITGSLPLFLYAPANYLAWFFYFPSQVLISHSSKQTLPKTQKTVV